MSIQKNCFVVMGFGIKTDYATGRKLDLDKSYRLLIKPVVEGKGLRCVRADEIRHSGSIDVPMYQELLQADLVVADLSTANLNAFYELGIRHALRPRTTIVISEDKLPYPFDLNHIKITKYTHLGDAIDYEEVERFRNELGNTIEAVLNGETADSPVYTFLSSLIPPSLREEAAKVAEQVEESLMQSNNNFAAANVTATDAQNQSLALLIEQGEQALKKKEFAEAKAFFSSALLIGKTTQENFIISNNPYLLHRLALATYKAQEPDLLTALKDAIALLKQLSLEQTNDPETVALAGAIEKRLYENGQGDEHLKAAIQYYERGYYLLKNPYNGINLAFMLNCRADSSLDKTNEEKIADMVFANRIRQEVLAICEQEWAETIDRENRAAVKASQEQNEAIPAPALQSEQKFWLKVNMAEAYFGLGDFAKYAQAQTEAQALPHDNWMMESFERQRQKLSELLTQHGHLLNPQWVLPTLS